MKAAGVKKGAASKRVAAATTATNAKKTTKVAPGTRAANKMPARRADYGAPIDGFFGKQPPPLRVILEELRKLVEETGPNATASIKWGMPFYSVGGEMMCALAGFKSHVNLILAGPPETFADPGGRLEGDGKTGRHLKLRTLDELPRDAVRGWLRAAERLARSRGRPS